MEITVERLVEQLSWVTGETKVNIGALVLEGERLLIISEGEEYKGNGAVWKPDRWEWM